MNHRLGVVAVVPYWSQSDNLNADSNYVCMRTMLPAMSKIAPDVLFLVFFPDPAYGRDSWHYSFENIQTDRIKFISWPYDTQMSTSVVGFDPVRFSQIEQNFCPTMYWLHQVEMGAMIYSGYTHSWAEVSTPAVVAQHHYIIHRSLPYQYEAMFPRQWLQIGGSMASERVVYNSEYCKSLAHDAFTEYITQEQWSALDAKSVVLPFGLLRGDEPIAPEADKDNEPVFVYNHRFEAYKQPEITFALIDELHARYKFKVYATQVSGQKTGGVKKFHYDKSVYASVREEYLRNIAVPAINTMNSIHETFCISILDSLACGHLVVLPDALTFPELVPAGYPFLFKSVDEQRAMLSSILEHWPEDYNFWRIKLAEHARSVFSVESYAHSILDIMMTVENGHRQSSKKEHTRLGLEKVFETMKYDVPYAPSDLRTSLPKATGVQVGPQAFPTRRIVREAMMMRDDLYVIYDKGRTKIIKRKRGV